jgi:mannose-6-phosphate isomerase-like protein (cupin superfamily)
MSAINLAEKLTLFTDHWSPRIIAQLNGSHVKLAKVKGRFPWHTHTETDELFLVVSGHLSIDIRGEVGERTVEIGDGEIYIVPKGVEHAPHAAVECHILLLERAGTVNTGDAPQKGTTGEWI